MSQKAFISPSVLIAIILLMLIFSGSGFLLGREYTKKSEFINSQAKKELTSEAPPASEPKVSSFSMEQEDQLKTTKNLPDIAQAVVRYELESGNKNPVLRFTANDGDYARVAVGQVGIAGGYVDFLIKRDNKWIVVWQGNGLPACSDINPIVEKYSIQKNFLNCY